MKRLTYGSMRASTHDTPRHRGIEQNQEMTSSPRCLGVLSSTSTTAASGSGWMVLALVLVTLVPRAVLAHHAFSAEFDSSKPVELKGVVTKIQWTNPHSWIYVDVKEPNGQVTSWAVEFGSPYSLLQKGLRKTSFPIGVEVVVKGHRAKSGKTVANGSSVTLPDGKGFYTGAEDSPGAQASAARD